MAESQPSDPAATATTQLSQRDLIQWWESKARDEEMWERWKKQARHQFALWIFAVVAGVIGFLVYASYTYSKFEDRVQKAARIEVGQGHPHKAIGDKGDLFLDSTEMDFFARSDSEWTLLGSLKGSDGLVGRGVEVGMISAWPSDLELPRGWLLCDGSAAKAGSALERILGDAYRIEGVVRLPDFRGVFLRGLDDSSLTKRQPPGLDIESAIREIGSLQEQGIQHHKHTSMVTVVSVGNLKDDWDTTGLVRGGSRIEGADDQKVISGPASNSVDSPLPPETRPVNRAVNWIIFAGE